MLTFTGVTNAIKFKENWNAVVNPQETVDLVTFTEEILHGKLYFLCSEYSEITLTAFFSETYQKYFKRTVFCLSRFD